MDENGPASSVEDGDDVEVAVGLAEGELTDLYVMARIFRDSENRRAGAGCRRDDDAPCGSPTQMDTFSRDRDEAGGSPCARSAALHEFAVWVAASAGAPDQSRIASAPKRAKLDTRARAGTTEAGCRHEERQSRTVFVI